jgi:hypothetical protein
MQEETEQIRSTLLEIVERIRAINQKNSEDQIPTSDIIHKLLGDIGESQETIDRYLRILVDAHYVISFKIIEADEARDVASINGYVIAEHGILNAIYERLCQTIGMLYENQFYQRKSPSGIIKEILGKGSQFQNTPIGYAVNAAVMIQQYLNVLVTAAEEYTEAWRLSHLNQHLAEITGKKAKSVSNENQAFATAANGNAFPIMMDEEGLPDSFAPKPYEAGEEKPKRHRAVDSEEYSSVEHMDRSGKWGEAVEKFGVEFLLRIHFRKYEFDRVFALVKTNRITAEKDLRYIRDTLRKLEERMTGDDELMKYRGRITDLRRLAQMNLNKILIRKKEM